MTHVHSMVDRHLPHRFRLKIPPQSRNISDKNWEIIEPINVNYWKKACELFSNLAVQYGDKEYRVLVKFDPVIEYLLAHIDASKLLHGKKDWSGFETLDRYDSEISIFVYGDERPGKQILEYLLYKLFIVLTISSPGSVNFGEVSLHSVPPRHNVVGGEIYTKFDLDGGIFEAALYEHESCDWARVEHIDFSTTWSWISRVVPDFTMLPENPAGSSIFALLNIAKLGYGPESYVWLFYALESLFDCKTGENFRILTERISVLLQLNQSQCSRLKKELRKIYDIRSAFVHGGLRVVHPMGDEGLDARADDASWNFVRPLDFGVTLVLICIQRLISKGWLYPMFVEEMRCGGSAGQPQQ